jgi:DNA-binding NarL/FixJ family response regulator
MRAERTTMSDRDLGMTQPPGIAVAIIEDDPVTLVGLSEVIKSSPNLTLKSAVRSVEAFDIMRPSQLDVVILDLGLRGDGVDGVEAVRHLRARDLTVLVVSMSEEETPVVDAMDAGAAGYLTKEAEPDEIVRAVTAVAKGRTYLSATVAGYLLKDRVNLTERERQVLRLVASGETTHDLAIMLNISEKTVNGTLERIRNKTGLRRRAELTRYALEQGIVKRNRRKAGKEVNGK